MLKTQDKIFFFLKDKYAILTFFLIVVHQSIIASSIYFLTKLIYLYQSEQKYTIYLILYLVSMIVPYIPGILSFITLQKWINSSHKKIINKILNSSDLRSSDFRNNTLRENINSLASRNSFTVVNNTLSFSHGFISLLLNSLLSVLLISFLLPKAIAFGYIFSCIISFLLIIQTNKYIEKINIDAEEKFIKYGSVLSRTFDNISIGNKINRKNLIKNIDKYGDDYYCKILLVQYKRQIINFILSIFSLIPTGFLIFITVLNEVSNSAIIAVIIVNLTRIFTVLSSLNSLLNSIIEFPAIIGRLKVLFSFIDDKDEIISEIKGIYINEKLFKSVDEMKLFLINSNAGRYTITGENGSGKTTFVHYLKDALGEDSIIIPTNLNGLYWGENVMVNNHSTGQKMKNILKNILKSDHKFIILDEWNANLDEKNKSELNTLINVLSKEKVLIEIVHK